MPMDTNKVCSTVLITGLFVIAILPQPNKIFVSSALPPPANPCMNDGVLETDAQGVDLETCLCLAGFYGDNCENVLMSFSCFIPSDCGSSAGIDCVNEICTCTSAVNGVFPKQCDEAVGAEECKEDSDCLNGGNCTDTFRCVCKPGFTGAGKCADVNECTNYQEAVCTDPDLPVCINTVGSFTCVPCPSCEDRIKTAACRASAITDITVPNGCAPFLQ